MSNADMSAHGSEKHPAKTHLFAPPAGAPKKLQYARLTPIDAPAMFNLERECFSMFWSLEQCRSALKQSHFAAFGIWQDGKLVAYLSFYHIKGELEIANLAVSSGMRRKGIGQHLLILALHTAHKMGMQKAVLEVRPSNRPAIALYEKIGFAKAGRRPRYFTDTGEDALIYTCQIAETCKKDNL